MAVEPEQVDAQKHYVKPRIFSAGRFGTTVVPGRLFFCEKENKAVSGEGPAKFWTGKREQARIFLHRAQALVAGDVGFLTHEKRVSRSPFRPNPKLTENSRDTGDLRNPLGF